LYPGTLTNVLIIIKKRAPGILTSLLLLINQFPDTEAGKEGGRKHLVICFGKQKAAYIYAFGLLLTYGIIAALPFFGVTSRWIFLALIPLPIAFCTGFTAIKHYEIEG
jgi:1,4-dihydroxy-2-naphthoate polyprenyltransferase